ncbi:MAG: hypothetical protein CUN56_04415 [Phototrophicales bacterium]|nr:MAG: hypothetical protein CUN56_04415 [Phototrophicales bacterium]RMG75704.1 MAG: branched-chain amino acid ABC transporter permease [Chloroflexota bacterium]
MATNVSTQKTRFSLQNLNWQQIWKWTLMGLAVIFLMWLGARIDENPRGFLQATVSGVLVGGIYSLVAVGIVMINKASGIFNFAHGAMMLVSAFIFFSFYTTQNYSMVAVILLAGVTSLLFVAMNNWRDILIPRNALIALLMTGVLVVLMTLPRDDLRLIRALVGGTTGAVLIGLMIERFSIRPLMGQPIFTMILMTLALDSLFKGVSQMLWGSIDQKLTIFSGLQATLNIPATIRIDTSAIIESRISTINIQTDTVLAFILSVAAYVAFALFFQYTNIGLAMRATSENQRLAQSVGLRVRAILAAAWAIAALLALTAGVLYGAGNGIGKNMPDLAIRAFPAVLLGGLESIGGAMIGGIVIGLAQTWADSLFGSDAGTQLAPYVILMIVLIVRPDGLFGQKRIERI